MSKVFVFAIGGTGSRVLRSIIMLMASGLKLNASQVVPIIIDPDAGNKDLSRTIEALETYKAIQETASKDGNTTGFFPTPIENIFSKQLPFRMSLKGVEGRKFREYIGFDSLDQNNKDLGKLLFSDYHLNLDMEVGFKGNPNLGSIVLNQFQGNADFKKFSLNFSPDDRIFIISSIHGGTGAAGFPLLVKNILHAQAVTPNHELIKNAIIGAITVLPYFMLQAGEIKSQDFISKTKAALEYYRENLNNQLNSLYYIGFNNHTKSYENNPGGNQQKNPAHFVELASAMALFDFLAQPDTALQTKGARFMEFGTASDIDQKITFDDLDPTIKAQLRNPLSQFFLLSKYLDIQARESIGKQPWGIRGTEKTRIGNDFVDGDFFKNLERFSNEFKVWVKELANNSPAFSPFNIEVNKDNLTGFIQNQPLAKKPIMKDNFTLFDDHLNGSERDKVISNQPREVKFLNVFFKATQELLNKNYKIKS